VAVRQQGKAQGSCLVLIPQDCLVVPTVWKRLWPESCSERLVLGNWETLACSIQQHRHANSSAEMHTLVLRQADVEIADGGARWQVVMVVPGGRLAERVVVLLLRVRCLCRTAPSATRR